MLAKIGCGMGKRAGKSKKLSNFLLVLSEIAQRRTCTHEIKRIKDKKWFKAQIYCFPCNMRARIAFFFMHFRHSYHSSSRSPHLRIPKAGNKKKPPCRLFGERPSQKPIVKDIYSFDALAHGRARFSNIGVS